jgi:predicted GNAT family N-acyltransferase
MRGQGIGKLIMLEIDRHLSNTKTSKITLDAQFHAKKFYESLGYTQEGAVFEEVGIPHVVMTKQLG